jgi:RimJ/RimL family protein N-acetyltransferase
VSRIVLPAEPLLDGATALRPWRDSDLPALVHACQDPEISLWTRVPFPYGDADARQFLLHRIDAVHGGTLAPFAIVSAADHGSLLGSISLMSPVWSERRAEVGYWLAREARGRGHATRALVTICRWGFRNLGLERVELCAASTNAASQRVAERAGFARELVLRSYMETRAGRHDMVGFALLADSVGQALGG